MRTMRPSGHETPKVPWVLLSRVELSLEKCPPCHKRVSCCCPPPPCTVSLLWWLRVRCLLACYSYIHNTKANGTWQPSQHHFLRHSVSLARSLTHSLGVCVNCAWCVSVCVWFTVTLIAGIMPECVCVCSGRHTTEKERARAGERKKARCTANGSEALQATGKADVNLKILRNWIKVKIL